MIRKFLIPKDCKVNNGECYASECKEFQFGSNSYSDCLCKKGYLPGLTLYENCKGPAADFV